LENITESLKQLRLSSGKSQADFAKIIGVSQRTWSSYESGETRPKMAVIIALEAKGYFIKGLTSPVKDLIDEGKITKEEARSRLDLANLLPTEMDIDESASKIREMSENLKKKGKSIKVYPSGEASYELPERKSFVIPLLNQKLSAGNGADLPENDDVVSLVQVPRHLSSYGEKLAALTVEGDSMYPTLSRGDLVVCDSCGWSGEGVYALRMGGEGFVKRITKDTGKMIVISDNPKYPMREYQEDAQDFELIGRVHCAIKKVE
jgi:transcriptional regulator with XRE-family HTH domain